MDKKQAEYLRDFVWTIFGSILNVALAIVTTTIAYHTSDPGLKSAMMFCAVVAAVFCMCLAVTAKRTGKRFVASFADMPAVESSSSES